MNNGKIARKQRLANLQKIKNTSKEFKLSNLIKILKKIYNKNSLRIRENILPSKQSDLLSIATHPDMLHIIFKKLSRNKGAMTPGTKGNTTDDASEE